MADVVISNKQQPLTFGQLPVQDYTKTNPGRTVATFQNTQPKTVATFKQTQPVPVTNFVDPDVKVYLDPTDRRIKITAPQELLDSPAFKDDFVPYLNNLVGKDVTAPEVNNVLSSKDLQESLNRLSREAMDRQRAINLYKQSNEKASDNDAILALQIAGAADRPNDDAETAVTLISDNNNVRSPLKDRLNAQERTLSVKDAVTLFGGMGDATKARYLQNLNGIIDNPNSSPRLVAIAQGTLSFLNGKKLLNASDQEQNRERTRAWASTLWDTLPGAVGAALARNFNDIDANKLRQEWKEDPRALLEGAKGKAEGDKLLRTAVGLGLDLASTAGIGGGLAAGARVAGAVAGRIGSAGALGLLRTERGTDVLRGAEALSQGASRVAANPIVGATLRDTPYNLGYGLQDAATNAIGGQDQNYTLRDFGIDTLVSAGLAGGVGAVGKAARGIETSRNATLNNLSSTIGRQIIKAGDVFTKIPKIKNFSTAVINKNTPLIRAVRRAYANKDITLNEYQDFFNKLDIMNKRGAGEVRNIRRNSPEYIDAASDHARMTPEELKVANEYNNAYQTVVHAERGGYGEVSEKKLTALRQEVDELAKQMDEVSARTGSGIDPQAYRQKLIAYNGIINNYATSKGLFDAELFNILQESGAITGDYTALQRNIDRAKNYFAGKTNRLNSAQPVKKLKGISDVEAIDPLLVANERFNALGELAAKNDVDRFIANGIEKGWIQGRILQDPVSVAARQRVRALVGTRKDTINKYLQSMSSDLATKLPNLVAEVENAGGDTDAAIKAFNSEVLKVINSTVKSMLKDEKVQSQIAPLLDSAEDSIKLTKRQIALEMLQQTGDRINQYVDKAFAGTPMDAADQAEVKDAIKQTIKEQTTRAIARAGATSGVNDIFDEIRALNNNLNGGLDDASNTQAYFVNGGKGYFEVADPELIDYFNKSTSPLEFNMLERFLQNASRVFRLGTTGAEAGFIATVNPLRDSLQTMVLSGTGLFDPRLTRQTLLDVAANGDRALAQEWEQSFDDVMRYGAFNDLVRERPRSIIENQEDLRAAGASKIKEVALNTGDWIAHPIKYLKNPELIARRIEDITSVPEIAMRKRIYTTRLQDAKARGLSDEEAATEALFYSVNAMTAFSHVGQNIERFARTIPYLNAAIQGVSSFNRLAAIDPIGVATRIFGGVVSPVAYLTAYNLSDPERANTYFNTPLYEREGNFIVALDGGTVLKIPMSQELAAIVNPVRETIEAMNGLGEENFMQSLIRGFAISSPLDIGGFVTPDVQGNIDLGNATTRLAGGLLPQGVRPIIEAASGENLYTGNPLAPTEAELVERGQLPAGQEATAGDLTYTTNDSQSLRNISDFIQNTTGRVVPQGVIQNFVNTLGGSIGGQLVNGIDKIIGAPEDRQGGRAIEEIFSRRLFNKNPNQADQDFRNGLRELEQEKAELTTRLARSASDAFRDPTQEGASQETRDSLIQDFGARVSDFASKYGEYYERIGGLNSGQKRRLVDLMNLVEDKSYAFEPGTPEYEQAKTQFMEGRNAGNLAAARAGLPTQTERDAFGRQTINNGNVETTRANDSTTRQFLRDTLYGTPKQAIADFKELTGKSSDGATRSLQDIRDEYQTRIGAIFDKDKLESAGYDEIEAIQNEYMQVFDDRVKPLVDKYGALIFNNNDVVNELRGLVLIPRSAWAESLGTGYRGRDEYISSKEFPNAAADVKKILLERYGVGGRDTSNLTSDQEVTNRIESINSKIDKGRRASAMSEARLLQQKIARGTLYIDELDQESLRNILGGGR